MPYLIDGHNLIPKLGLRLDSIDDESELIAILQEFSRRERRQVEVFFDGAPAARAGPTRAHPFTCRRVGVSNRLPLSISVDYPRGQGIVVTGVTAETVAF